MALVILLIQELPTHPSSSGESSLSNLKSRVVAALSLCRDEALQEPVA